MRSQTVLPLLSPFATPTTPLASDDNASESPISLLDKDDIFAIPFTTLRNLAQRGSNDERKRVLNLIRDVAYNFDLQLGSGMYEFLSL